MTEEFASKFALPTPVQAAGSLSEIISRVSSNPSVVENLCNANSEIATLFPGNTSLFQLSTLNSENIASQEMIISGFKNSLASGIKWFGMKPANYDVDGIGQAALSEKRVDNVTGNGHIYNIGTNNISSVEERKQQRMRDNTNWEYNRAKSTGFPAVKRETLEDCAVQLIQPKIEETGTATEVARTLDVEAYLSLLRVLKKEEENNEIFPVADLQSEQRFGNYFEETFEMSANNDQQALQRGDLQNQLDVSSSEGKSICSSDGSERSFSSSPPDFWGMDDYPVESSLDTMNFSNFVEEIDTLLTEQEGKIQAEEKAPSCHENQFNLGDTQIPDTTTRLEQPGQAVPQIDLNSHGIQLLLQALQTQSLIPIVHLLQKALAGSGYSGNAINYSEQYRDPSSVASPEPSTRSLSTQNSFDSDQFSEYSELSPRPIDNNNNNNAWNDISPGYVQNEADLEIVSSLSNIFNNGAVLGAKKDANQRTAPKRPAINAVSGTPNKIPRIVPQAESSSANQEIDNIIEDIICSSEQCDLQTFETLLDKDTTVIRSENNKYVVKIFKNVSTETAITNKITHAGAQQRNESSASLQKISEPKENGQPPEKRERKRGNKHSTLRPGPNKCYHLWDFLRDLLDSNNNADVIHWVDKGREEFKLVDTKRLADLWGARKRLKNMNYDKLSRSLRYYIKLDILQKVPGMRLHFRFGTGRMWRKLT